MGVLNIGHRPTDKPRLPVECWDSDVLVVLTEGGLVL